MSENLINFPSTPEEQIAALATLGKVEYDQVRKSTAKKLGVRVETLDSEVARSRASSDDSDPTCPAVPKNNEPGWALLDDVTAFIRRFVAMTDAQAAIAAAWTLHTHAASVADYTPYLFVHSAEKQSGKTRLFEVLELLVSNPERSDNISVAALVHKIDKSAPTMLLDELDATFRGDKERAEILRGVLNSGFSRSGKYTRMVGDGASMEPVDFSTFSPKALAGIGQLPDTIASRAVPILLIRKLRHETVERFRVRLVSAEAAQLRDRLAGWACAHLDELRLASPVLPESLSDRQQDVIEPLLALADACGGSWPERLRCAVMEVFGSREADDRSLGVQLLTDIQFVFEQEDVDHISSPGLIDALVRLEGRPWAELANGKPITPNRLARHLSKYGIGPANIRDGGSQFKGYRLELFNDAFARYLPPLPTPPPGGTQTVPPSQANVYAAIPHCATVPGTVSESEDIHAFPAATVPHSQSVPQIANVYAAWDGGTDVTASRGYGGGGIGVRPSNLPQPPLESATPLQSNTGAGSSDFPSATPETDVADAMMQKPAKTLACSGVADKTPKNPLGAREQGQNHKTCWHCGGERTCECIACWDRGRGTCVPCKGSGLARAANDD